MSFNSRQINVMTIITIMMIMMIRVMYLLAIPPLDPPLQRSVMPVQGFDCSSQSACVSAAMGE